MFDQEMLAHIWFVILWAVFASYLVLDGFDFGVGVSYLFGTESEKSRLRSAIGPFWDGNETWLVLFAGIMFAAFPLAYGNLLSNFYVITYLLLFSLIFRGARLEFRSLVTKPYLQKFWDGAFFASSVFVPMLLGIIASNTSQEIAANQQLGSASMQLNSLFNIEAISTGLFLVSLLGVHGTNFMQLRSDGELQHKCCKLSLKYCFSCMACLLCMSLIQGNTFRFEFAGHWQLSLVGILAMFFFLFGMYVSIWKHRRLCSFVLSAVVIALSVSVFALSIYPNLTMSATLPGENITIIDAMSSHATLTRMLIFAAIGMPFVIVYTYMSYRIFWKK